MSDLLKNTLKTISKTFKGNNKQTKRSSKKTAPSSVKKPKNTSNKNKATVAKIKNQDKLKAANKKANQNKGLKAVSSVMNPSKNKLNKTTSLPSQQTMKQKGKAAKKKQQEDLAKKKAAAEARAKEMDYKAAQKNNDLLDKSDLFKLQRNDPLYEKVPHLDPVIRRQASNAVNYGAVPKDLEKATAVVDDVYISGKYLNFDSEAAALDYQERFKKWQKENTYTIKKYNSVTKKFEKQQALKLNATAPPMGVDVNGNKPPADWEDSWKYYLKFNKEIEFQTDMSVKQTQDMTADYTDISDKTSNSFFDVVRDSNKAYLDAADKYEGEIGRSQKASLEYFKTLFKGLYNYSTRYIWNPIRTGNWGILLNNTLTNLGETMDYVAIGFKAIASAKTPKMYGAKHGFDDTKEAWVYSGGRHLQEKMMKLGARNAFTSGEAPYATAEEAYEEMVLPWVKGDSAKWDKKRKKTKVYSDDSTYEGETTLKEEFIRMYNEWYFKGGKETQKGDISEALAEAYTTHKHVDVDTGFLPTDIIGEMALDPGVLLGGFASMGAKAGVEGIVKTGVKSGLDSVAKNGDEAVKVLDASKELSRRYTKNLGKDLLTKNYKAVEKDIDTITEALIKDGVISKESKTVFSVAMNHSLKEAQDTMNWKIVRSLHYTDRTVDAIDSGVLKGIFVIPYTAYKLPKTVIKAVRSSDAFARRTLRSVVKKRQTIARIISEVEDFNPNDVEIVFNALGKEDIVKESEGVVDELVSAFVYRADQDKQLFKSIIEAVEAGKLTDLTLPESLDNFAAEVLKDPTATIDTLKLKLEELSQKFTGRNDDLTVYFKVYEHIFKDITELERVVKIDTLEKCFDDLQKIHNTNSYLETLGYYKGRIPEDIYNDLTKFAEDRFAKEKYLKALEKESIKNSNKFNYQSHFYNLARQPLPPVPYRYTSAEEWEQAAKEWDFTHSRKALEYYTYKPLWDANILYDQELSNTSELVLKKDNVKKLQRFDRAINSLERAYPIPGNGHSVQIGTIKDVDEPTLGINYTRALPTEPARIEFNPIETSSVELITALKAYEDSLPKEKELGFSALEFVVDTPEGVAVHEWGHNVQEYIALATAMKSPVADRFWDWYNSLSDEVIKEGLSEYATVDAQEFIAESFLDLLTGSSRDLSLQFAEYLKNCIAFVDEYFPEMFSPNTNLDKYMELGLTRRTLDEIKENLRNVGALKGGTDLSEVDLRSIDSSKAKVFSSVNQEGLKEYISEHTVPFFEREPNIEHGFYDEVVNVGFLDAMYVPFDDARVIKTRSFLSKNIEGLQELGDNLATLIMDAKLPLEDVKILRQEGKYILKLSSILKEKALSEDAWKYMDDMQEISIIALKMEAMHLQNRFMFKQLNGKLTETELNILNSSKQLADYLNVTFLSNTVSDSAEYVRWQQNIALSAENFMMSTAIQRTVRAVKDTSNPLGNLISKAEQLAGYYKVYRDSSIDKFVDTLDSAGQLAKFRDLTGSVEDDRVFFEGLKGTVVYDAMLDVMQSTGLTDPLDLIKLVQDRDNDVLFELVNELLFIKEEIRSYEAYDKLQKALTPKDGRKITSEEQIALLDTLFKFHGGNPEEYLRGGRAAVENILNSTQLWMDAVYGNTKASTDGFTQEVLDFHSEMWQSSKYFEEAQIPEVQEALKKWVSGGHLNPMDDVKKQMLMSVVKDPEGIKYYNSLAEKQPVYFMDIETQGMNKLTDEITAIAMKEWVSLDENASLMEILEVWDKSAKEYSFHSYLPEAELRDKISNDVLELCYKYDKTIAPTREARLEQYFKDFGAEANGKTVTEKEIMSQAMYTLDSIFLNSKKNPVLVTHSNNGFDMGFFTVRAGKTGEFPKHIKHLNELESIEENSLRRVKVASGDPVILKDHRDYMKEVLYEYMREISSFKYDMRVMHPSKLSQAFKNVDDICETLRFEGGPKYFNGNKTVPKQMSELPDVGNFLKQAQDESLGEYLHKLNSSVQDTTEDLKAVQRIYKNNITFDPYRMSVEDLDFYEKNGVKVFKDDEKQQIKEAVVANDRLVIENYNKELRDRYLEVVGTYREIMRDRETRRPGLREEVHKLRYTTEDIDNVLKLQKQHAVAFPEATSKKIFSAKDIKEYFNIVSSESVTLSDMRNMQNFSKYVGTAVSKLIKDTSILQGCKADFDAIINYCQQYASQLGTLEDFSYMKYLRAPDTLAESYVMAQKLWDIFTCNGRYDDVMRYIDAEFDEIPEEFRSMIMMHKLLGDGFDIRARVGELAQAILDDTGKVYHSQIMRNVPRKDYYDLDVDWFNDAQEFNALVNDFKNQATNLDNYSIRLEASSKFANETDLAIKVGMSKFVAVSDYIRALPEDAQRVFRLESRNVMERMCKDQTTQVMDFITKDKDNLLAHLLFNNQVLIVPLDGDELYMKQLKDLQDMLSEDVDHVVYTEYKGQLCIALKKDDLLLIRNDSKYSVETTEMKFKGEDKVYTRPEYKRISIGEDAFSDEYLSRAMREMEDSLDYLTEGAARGSTGVLYSLSKHTKMLKELPTEFVERMITEETTCDARLWHGANFDMSLLGEYRYRWKLGNENDLLLRYMATYKEVVSKVKAERLYLDSFFNNDTLKLGNFFKGEDIKDIIKAMDDTAQVAVVYEEGKTSSGFQVKQVKLTDELSFEVAKAKGAVMVSYDTYVNMVETINDTQVSNTFLKYWGKYLALVKTGQIMWGGTWIRNYIDGTIKAAGDVGSLTNTMKHQLTAVKLMVEYSKVSKFIDKSRGLSYQTAGETYRFWDAVQAGTHTRLTLQQYEFLEGWFNASISGGESRVYKSILQMRKNVGYANNIFKENIGDFDAIASKAQRFADLPVNIVENMVSGTATEIFASYGFTKAEFMAVFNGMLKLDEVTHFKYEQLCEELLHVNKAMGRSKMQGFNSAVDSITNKLLMPMSKAEEVMRLGEYLALADEGYDSAQIFKKITESQFNYDLKSDRAKLLEMVIPFYTFMHDNAIYWFKQVSQNPRMLRYLENVWVPATWDDIEESDEDYIANKSLYGLLNSGNIALGDTGVYVKINPSFLDAMKWIYNFPDAALSSMAGPLQLLMRSSMRQLGADSWQLWSEASLWSNDDDLAESLIKQVPITGSIYARASRLVEQQPWLKLAEDSPSFMKYLTYISSLFGVDSRMASGSFEDFKKNLEKQGKWWDNNTQSVRDISEKNYEGLNDPRMLWTDRALHNLALGKVWDNNQRKYVRFADFQYGGLNKDFDFTNPDDWEEYSKLRERMFGEKYDANVGKWVSVKDYSGDVLLNDSNLTWNERVQYMQTIRNLYWDANQGCFVRQRMLTQGGLNSKDLSWNEIQIYNYTIFGKEWDKSQHKFVKTTEPVVEFQLQGLYTEIGGHVKPKKAIGDRLADKLGINVYATKDGKPKQNKIKSKYIITGDPAKDAEVYKRLLQDFSYIATNYGKNYKSGYSGGYYHKARSYTPKRTSRPKGGSSLGSLKNLNTGIKSGGKVYGTAYSSGKNQAGLRMATSNYTAYDKYYHYNYEYNYVYQYKNAVTGVANYPQTKLGIDRYMSLRNDAMNQKLLNYNRYSLSQVSNRYQMGIKQRLNDIKLTQYRH